MGVGRRDGGVGWELPLRTKRVSEQGEVHIPDIIATKHMNTASILGSSILLVGDGGAHKTRRMRGAFDERAHQ